ncbi:MAG TPA: bifunctional 2-polyprenyl-6-hydroxyphenol methylase/3-demethylubiquinol 3-O-methyltransferase UbiG [Microvirga sp.]|jgi:2-polyprenyl-6-hydroxyphenyl methylase/3-demethylubiquinone-9 3-methyltransferase|nr:bifunctional 2-polyprenyl-6-hydroxyphenol methylase/3-demethylubiquinol 3-O-methyltransferase UbiG [Microvirga sp.]
MGSGASTVDQAQVDHFDAAGDAWAPDGYARWLYRYNPARVGYIRDRACAAFGRDPAREAPLTGLRILDIGCGTGILCEPLAELGASVIGADPAERVIAVGAARAETLGLAIDYRGQTAEALAEAGERFDVVTAMEVIEHVADTRLFLQTCAELVKPGGVLVLSTMNRTAKSWFQAIVMAEYVLGLLPRGAHQWRRFVRPEEVDVQLAPAGMRVTDVTGVTMNLRTLMMQPSRRTGVNYMLAARRGTA